LKVRLARGSGAESFLDRRGARSAGRVTCGVSNILLSIHTEDGNEVKRAKEIFKRAGAEDIAYTGEANP
jgi:hypothetical protein